MTKQRVGVATLLLVLGAGLLIPLWLVHYCPPGDYPNHIARANQENNIWALLISSLWHDLCMAGTQGSLQAGNSATDFGLGRWDHGAPPTV